MAGRWRRALAKDGWLSDLLEWVQSPADLLRTPPRDPNRPVRKVFYDAEGNVVADPRQERRPLRDALGAFQTTNGTTERTVMVRVRADVGVDDQQALALALDGIPWERLGHAYGPAVDVPVLLFAVTLAEADARDAAWWELWGNIHHQGTVYEATVPAVEFVAAVARDPEHPDRVQALTFLREVALGDGEHARAVRDAVRPHAERLLEGARDESELAQRGLLWLLSAFPSRAAEHVELVQRVPPALQAVWPEVLDQARTRHGPGEHPSQSQDSRDRQDELERWALAGWHLP